MSPDPVLPHTPEATEALVPEPEWIIQSSSIGIDIGPSGSSEPTCFLETVPDLLWIPEFCGWWEEGGIVVKADHLPVCIHPFI